MKRWSSVFWRLMLIALSFLFGTFLILDACNPAMKLLDSKWSVGLLWIFCILSVLCAGEWICENYRQQVRINEEPQEWC